MKNSEIELEKLRQENRGLNEQVKKLVRAERRLALSRQDVDRRLRQLQTLNELSLKAGSAVTLEEILDLTLRALFSSFPFEQGAAFLHLEPDSFVLARSHSVQGMELSELPSPTVVRGSGPMRLSCNPWIGDASRIAHEIPALAPFMDTLKAHVPASPAKGTSPAILALAIGPAGERPVALLLVRRVSAAISLLEPLPGEADLSFLKLIGSHATIALQNLSSLREAQDAIRAREEFLSIASHELKTPLTSLLLHFQSLQRVYRGDQRFQQRALTIERQCQHLALLIDQLLDVSRIRVGRLTPRPEEFDFSIMLSEVISQLTEDLDRSGSRLSADLPPSHRIFADPAQMKQVVINLLSNSIKFGLGKPISLRLWQSGDATHLEIKDQGIGIDAQDLKRIFERFERAVSSRHFGGLGLGLYITRQIIEAHGGRIAVQSRKGEGSTFTVEIPSHLLSR